MKFGLFCQHSTPRPWTEDSEKIKFNETLEQAVLADRLGFDSIWLTEHHFMEEYCHSTAPEVFLAAISQVTSKIRIGHGIRHAPPPYNHPVRTAEQTATLDILSNGRVELGLGSSGSEIELRGFGIANEEKHDMTYEAVEQIANMLAMDAYPGHAGRYFSMPARNIIPKPLQKPHPPLWLACSARPTIIEAARRGMGAMCFSFLDAAESRSWVDEYYNVLKTECRPIGHAVNPNFNLFTGFGVHQDAAVAVDRFMDGMRFFQWCLSHYYRGGTHRPGRVNLWERYLSERDEIIRNENDEFVYRQIATSRGSIGSVEQVRQRFRALEAAGVDQVVLIMQVGNTRHEHICESMELFAKEIMPEFKARDGAKDERKRAELAPFIDDAFARIGGQKPTHLPDEMIAEVTAKNYIARYAADEAVLGTKATAR